ncbi:MAG: hypothetical protein WBL87_06115, partial [Methanothrix sp.]
DQNMKNQNFERETEIFIKNSVSKLKSNDKETKELGLLELQARWRTMNDDHKKFAINELVKALESEPDPHFKLNLIRKLCELLSTLECSFELI